MVEVDVNGMLNCQGEESNDYVPNNSHHFDDYEVGSIVVHAKFLFNL